MGHSLRTLMHPRAKSRNVDTLCPTAEVEKQLCPLSGRGGDVDQITEGGIKQAWKETRKVAREVPGFGLGKFVRWDRHSLTNYTHLRTNKGHLNQIGRAHV